METFGGFLRAHRRARALTLGQLALWAEVNKATLSRWEAGTHLPRVPELLRVLDALGVSSADRGRALGLLDAPRAILALWEDADAAAMPVSLGDVLYSLRRRSGKTQADVARAVGVSRSLVSQWEQGASLPTAAQTHTVGYAFGASAEEVGELSTRAFARTPLEKSREALLHRYRTGPFWEADATEASDRLYLLTLLSGFGRLLRAGKADVGDVALIVSSFAGHAETWHNDRRQRDFYRRRALALAADARAPLHFHLASSVRVLLDARANPRPLQERVSAALDWRHRFQNNAGQAYLLSFVAAALAEESPDEALRLGDQYCALVADDPDEYPCRLHDRGNLLRKCGRAAESVAYLAALTPQDTFRKGLIRLDMAEGLTALGAKAEADHCLTTAKRIFSGTDIGLIQARLSALESAVN